MVDSQQFYADEIPGASVHLGREDWFCPGVISDEPFFMKRKDQSVWLFPDSGVEWWASSRFAKVADGFTEFFLEHVAGPGYVALSPFGDDDQWCGVLRHTGRLPG
jgi:hypothetical protein